jgi:hypothetical protein
MQKNAAYTYVDIDLSTVFTKRPVEGKTTYKDVDIGGVYLEPRDASLSLLPAGAFFQVHFGDNLPLTLSAAVPGYDFECGHAGGIYISNNVALPGQSVRLLIVFSGAERANA